MLKKVILISICVLLLAAAGAGFFLVGKFRGWGESEETKFRKSLKGEIVFSRRDGLYLNIYKINANGTGEKMLYHNPVDISAYLPEWSEDGEKIYFTTVPEKGGRAKKIMMDVDGNNVEPLPKGTEFRLGLTSQESREKDIVVDFGSIYYLNEKGEKILVYKYKNFDSDLDAGPQECSWSPDKKYIIFELRGYITIIDKEGTKMVKVTKGVYPDWKY